MQRKDIKYILLGSLLGAIIWFAILEIDWRAGLYVFRHLGFIGSIIAGIVAVPLGTYIGIWSIGKFRKPKLAYGILVGLTSFVLFSALRVMGFWARFVERGYTTRWFFDYLSEFIVQDAGLNLILGIVGGIIGMFVIRRISPSFCPYCGSKLPSGRAPCLKCGKTVC